MSELGTDGSITALSLRERADFRGAKGDYADFVERMVTLRGVNSAMVRLNQILAGLLLIGTFPLLAPAQQRLADPAPADIEFFEKKVRPLLVDNCYTCHSADTNSKGGLRVDDRQGLMTGGGRGAAVVPGDPERSLLLKAVRQTDDKLKLKMPPEKKLSDEDIETLTQWIQRGVAWPVIRIPTSVQESPAEYESLQKGHWAWQPLRQPSVPVVQNTNWPRDDIDRFLLAKLEEQKLAPVADADPLSLLRRITFDITGLPPTRLQIEEFLADESPDRVGRLVDRLLASPAYGEHWGRHWLDLARYGESTGSSRNLPMPHAWRYRDYVIRAFQQDKPYNVFIQEQIAGDLLPADSPAKRDEQTIATGFLAIGVKDVNQRFKVRYLMDNVDEQIDAVSRTVLALTASCARCHNHKFDPIPTSEYYGLAGIFRSSEVYDGLRNKMGGGGLDYYNSKALIPLQGTSTEEADPGKIEELKKAVQEAQKEFVALRDSPAGNEKSPDGRPKKQVARQKWNRLQQELSQGSDPAARGPVAFGIRDAQQVADTEIRIRGEAEKLGPVVPRRFLSLIDIPGQPVIDPQHSGRLELAEWLTHDQNALAQRVIVNRVWLHLFGNGLVQSSDNFGTTGDTPSHPELLDHLAQRFVQNGWSIKKLVRTLVLTRAYQLSSSATPEHLLRDPANRLVWRHSPRRLTGEEMRDAMLLTAGRLDPAPGVGSAIEKNSVVELNNNSAEARRIVDQGRASRHRSVYLPLVRGLVPTSLEVFDFADQGLVTGQRDATTVPQQALYLLNDAFVRRQAITLAEQTLKLELDDAAKIQRLYHLSLGRPATTAELDRARAYLTEYETTTATLLAEKAVAPQPDNKPNETPTVAATTQAEIVDPDQVDQSGPPVKDEQIPLRDARTAAWASFCQALIGSGEFRYIR